MSAIIVRTITATFLGIITQRSYRDGLCWMKRVGCACPRSSASVSHYYNYKVNQASLVLTAIVIVI